MPLVWVCTYFVTGNRARTPHAVLTLQSAARAPRPRYKHNLRVTAYSHMYDSGTDRREPRRNGLPRLLVRGAGRFGVQGSMVEVVVAVTL